MSFQPSQRDTERMANLHPDLRAVYIRALQLCPFQAFLAETLRSEEQCRVNYGKGRTTAELKAKRIDAKYAQPKEAKVTWLINPYNSKHCKQADGFAHAFDAYRFPFNRNQPRSDTFAIAKAMLAAAKELGVNMRWGKDWDQDGVYEEKGETDGPHFELAL